MKYEIGSTAFIIESNRFIREVVIVRQKGSFYIVRFADGTGGIQLKEHRIFPSREAAEQNLPKKEKKPGGFRSPYDYWH